MCGICGFVNLDGRPVDETTGHRMMELLRHRGPDGDGALVLNRPAGGGHPSVFLGHRRLKIIDLSDDARQPLPNEDRTVWVILNGEIYNYPELGRDLKARRHAFRSQSDTEVIVHAYEEHGEDFVRRLDGMFALALWDERNAKLILARDRSGKKPLFYARRGPILAFASEIKALLACPWIERKVAAEAIPEYLAFGYVPGPRTFYQGILQVPPGAYVPVHGTEVMEPRRYWKLEFPGGRNGGSPSMEEAAGRVRELTIEAVARRLRSDVPLGAFLSGGLDSTIVVGIMTRLLKQPVRTFTIGFTDDLSYDERPYARIAAKHFGTEHTEFAVEADMLSMMEPLLWHHDQPYGDSSAIPTWMVSRLARQHVTVVLNGDGGDEVFAGYDRFRAALAADRIPGWAYPLCRWMAHCLPRNSGYHNVRNRLERFLKQAGAPVNERYVGWLSFMDRSLLGRLLRRDVRNSLNLDALHDSFNARYAEAEGMPLLHRILYGNFMTYLPDDLHVKMDRMSMAHALETRSPLLDTALMEYAATLRPRLKIHRRQVKRVLKEAFRDVVPAGLLRRKKHGFGVPLGRWFRGRFGPQVQELLLDGKARMRDYLEHDAVCGMYREHLSGAEDHGGRLWVLMNFELWLRMLENGTLWEPRKTDETPLRFSVKTG